MRLLVVACMIFSVCWGKLVGFKNLASLAQVSTLNDDTVACQRCKEIVIALDKHGGVFNSSEEMAQTLQERCPQMPRGSPDEAFCKAIEGNYRVFTDAYFRHRDNPEIDPCQVAQICGPSFNNLASLSQAFALSNETQGCEDCRHIMAFYDSLPQMPEDETTPEKFAKVLQEICAQVGQGSPDEQFCKALVGKFDVFAKAYFQHRDHPEVDPCKVSEVCSAKSLGFNDLASLSKAFALINETEACEDCKVLVAYYDSLSQMPEDENTPEKLAKALQGACRDSRVPEEFCKALEGKFDVLATAYFQHRDNPEVDPCKEIQAC